MSLWIVTQPAKNDLRRFRSIVSIVEANSRTEALRKYRKTKEYTMNYDSNFAPMARLVEAGHTDTI